MSATLRMFRPTLLRAQPARLVQMQMQAQAGRRALSMKPTQALRSVPKEEHSAHTISQRLRTLKKIPPELLPLGFVIGFALVIAAYSSVRKFYTDKTLRLSRRGESE